MPTLGSFVLHLFCFPAAIFRVLRVETVPAPLAGRNDSTGTGRKLQIIQSRAKYAGCGSDPASTVQLRETSL
jgi:hypothetical protein